MLYVWYGKIGLSILFELWGGRGGVYSFGNYVLAAVAWEGFASTDFVMLDDCCCCCSSTVVIVGGSVSSPSAGAGTHGSACGFVVLLVLMLNE